jgi:putative transcription factor
MNDPRTSLGWDAPTTILRKSHRNQPKTVENPLGMKPGKVATERRDTSNKSHEPPKVAAFKLDQADEPDRLPEVGLSLAKRIQQARIAKSLTQAQLAQQINVKSAIINDYELGKGVPDNTVISKLERILAVKLR